MQGKTVAALSESHK